jgi:hypothetical protein
MTRLRIASLFVAVVAGDYAALMLIDGQLIDFGVAAAICAGSSVAAGLIAYADDEDARRQHELGKQRRKAVTRGRAPSWERRDQQAATAADQPCPLCGGGRQKLSDSTGFVDRQGARLCGACAAGPQPGANTTSLRPVSVTTLTDEQPERMRRGTASPALASPGIGLGGDDPGVEVLT